MPPRFRGKPTVPYTVRKRVAPFTVRVRVPPLTKTYMAMETYTYTVRVRYCAQYDLEFGSGCVKWAYRSEKRTGVRETLITEPAYHYENRPAYNYRNEQVCCKPVTRTVYRDETRTRQVCCRPVTRTVSSTRTVRETQSAVPSASCTAAGYSLNSSSRCERPVGTRLGAVIHSCASGWTAVSGDSSTCERTLSQEPTWACAAGHSIDRSTTLPHCHPDPDEDEDTQEDEEDAEEDEEDDENSPECTTALGTLGSGTVTRSGSWAAGCESAHKSTDQVPYYAWRFTFTVTGAATLDLDAVSSGDPHVYVTDSDGTVVGSDDDSGADGRDSRIRGLSLAADTYTIEVTTGSDREEGSFTLTLKLIVAASETVKISGFAAAEETPTLGKTAVVVTSGFTVAPADAECSVKPDAATVAPASGASRTVSLRVAAATTVTVTVTCTKGADSDIAKTDFKANPAPVRISGLTEASAPAGDADSVVVSEDFDVVPTDAKCTATPAAASLSPATGGTRTVSLEVDKGDTVAVAVTCSKNGASHRVYVKFTATRVGGCNSRLGAFGPGGVTVRGTISAQGDCTSMRRHRVAGRTSHARRHVLVLTSPGWVTATLRSAATNTPYLDTYLLILAGDAADGSGERLAFNDDQGRGHSTSRFDSRITRKFLPAGTYTVEATTYGWIERHSRHITGDYILRVNVDHTPVAAAQPEELTATVGTELRRIWIYQPGAATASITSVLPDGLVAAVNAADGFATLTVTAARVGEHDIDITYVNGSGTLTKTTTLTAACPASQTATSAGRCIASTATLAASCTPIALHGGLVWGRREQGGQYRQYASDAAAACDSLTHSGKAVYYAFSLPKRLPVELELRDPVNMATQRAGGAPSVTVWRVASAHPVTGRAVRYIATAAPASTRGPRISSSLDAGSYLIEIAPSRPVSRSVQDRWYKLRTTMPTGTRTHTDVQNVGNTGLGGAGMTLGSFLDARGSLIYGAHPDADKSRALDPFYPESPNYPWLPFTVDRCSIPPAWILHLAETAADKAAALAGPLVWLAAKYRLPNADEIADNPQFGGKTVPFVYGCMRHDFNWRNLHRVKHHLGYDTATGTWNDTVRKDADNRLKADLYGLCESKQRNASEASKYHTWELPNSGDVRRCKQAADTITAALGRVPFGLIGYDHD
ncbi:pre-peptidase C-terminal domain-containing protein [Candidatus Poriferisodalis sp.]|uniref:pre-peptidase C-terminal domain-containing protein n=1 Tax=Candidatus Poriferisodalis sp. TaxID=3101277 RepID=UPI003B5B050C